MAEGQRGRVSSTHWMSVTFDSEPIAAAMSYFQEDVRTNATVDSFVKT